MSEPKCAKCELDATYDSPEALCDTHWCEWWVSGLEPKTEEERITLMAETFEVMYNGLLSGAQYGEPERMCTRNCKYVFHMTGHRHVLGCQLFDDSPGCPSCGSPKPELHPSPTKACPDAFHATTRTP